VVTVATVPTSGVSGRVENQQTGAAVPGATVVLVEPVLSTGTTANGDFEIRVDPGTYTLRVSAPGFVTSHQAVTVAGTTITNVGTVALVPSSGAPSGVRGEVQNAQVEEAIAGALVQLVEVSLSAQTGTNGEFEILADPGTYTLRVSATGFVAADQQVTVVDGVITDLGVIALVPVQTTAQTALVLTWGTTPSDLDAHMTGPLEAGGRFHVYYPTSSQGSHTGPPWVQLDRDVRNGEGPETISVVQFVPGVYRFSVHDWSNRGSTTSTALSASGAMVRVIRDNQEVERVNIVTGQGGTLWRVLEIDGASGNITVLNTLEFHSDPNTID
jgi:uncharacterized protein YfaP (DUF2135 family)